MLHASIDDLDNAIRASGFSEAEILRAAGVAPRHLSDIRRGRRHLTAKLASRVKLAIGRLRRSKAIEARERETDGVMPHASSVAAQYRFALAYVQALGGSPASIVLDQEPGKRATADQTWLRAAHARRLALYIANQYLAIPQADLGRAARMTKSAVSIAIKELEDMRERPDVARTLAIIEEAFHG